MVGKHSGRNSVADPAELGAREENRSAVQKGAVEAQLATQSEQRGYEQKLVKQLVFKWGGKVGAILQGVAWLIIRSLRTRPRRKHGKGHLNHE